MTDPTPTGSEPTSREMGLATIMLILTPLFWAGHSVVARLVVNEIPTFSLISLRWLVAFSILFACVAPKVWSERWLIRKYWRYVLLTGVVGPVLFPCFLYNGLKTTTVTNTSIIQTTVPALITFIAWLVLRERVTWQQIFGIGVSSVGVLLIITQGNLLSAGDVQFVPGDLIILGGFIVWSIYTVVIRLKPPEMHANTLLAASMLIGGVAMLPLWIWEASQGQFIPTAPESIWAIGYIIIFPTLLAYFFYNHAINIVGPTKAGLASHLVPPLGIMLGVVFLDETLHVYHGISFAIIFTGVMLVIRGGRVSKTPMPS